MAATSAQIAAVQRMCGGLTNDDGTWPRSVVQSYIEEYPLLDERGEEPYTWLAYTTPPTQEVNDDWVPTYDLNAAAARIWQERAAAWTQKVLVIADGTHVARDQMFDHAQRQAAYYSARRAAKTFTMHKWPKESTANETYPWVANFPEDEDAN